MASRENAHLHFQLASIYRTGCCHPVQIDNVIIKNCSPLYELCYILPTFYISLFFDRLENILSVFQDTSTGREKSSL